MKFSTSLHFEVPEFAFAYFYNDKQTDKERERASEHESIQMFL